MAHRSDVDDHTDSAPSGKGLKGGALGLISSVVVGVASTAPAYSLAATLGYIVATTNGDGIIGVKAPAIILLAFLPMYFIAVGYAELNSREPDCGTTFTWVTRAFGPRTGWLGGWGIIAADIIVMANLAQIAGQYGFLLFGADGLAESKFWTTFAGVLWIVVMTYICYRGIEISARLQYGLLGIEIVVLVIFAVVALVKVYSGDATSGSITPDISWLWPSGISGPALISGILLAVFIYWGWDTAVSTNEESDDPAKTPGRAAVLSTLLLLGIYAIVAIASVAFAGVGDDEFGLANVDNADDVFAAIAPAVFGDTSMGKVMEILLIITVLTSASASTQTTILPTARTTLSMGVFGAAPKRFANVHPRYQTPTQSTIWMGAMSIAFYVALTALSDNVLADSIAAVGLMIAFYYGLTGFACVWYFRGTLTTSFRNMLRRGILPLLGALSLLGAFIAALIEYSAPDYGYTAIFGIGGVAVLGIGILVLGALLMFLWQIKAPTGFFRGETLPKVTTQMVKDADAADVAPGHSALNAPTAQEIAEQQTPPKT